MRICALTQIGYDIGLADEDRYQRMLQKKEAVQEVKQIIQQTSVAPQEMDPYLEGLGSSRLKQKVKAVSVLTRPQVKLSELTPHSPELTERLSTFDTEVKEQAEIQLKYAGYIEKEQKLAIRMMQLDNIKLPDSLDFHTISALIK